MQNSVQIKIQGHMKKLSFFYPNTKEIFYKRNINILIKTVV